MARPLIRDCDEFRVVRFKQLTRKERETAWLEERRNGVGGSEMGTILGLNKYSTPYRLWLEKTGREQPEDISGKWAIVKGKALERELRNRFKTLHPELEVYDGTDKSLISNEHEFMHASLDGILYDETNGFGVLEIKTANARRAGDWHDNEGNLVIPPYYLAQVTHYLAVTGWRWGYVYADIGESEPVEILFDRNEDDVNAVIKCAETFWGYVTRDEAPELSTAEEVKLVHPDDDGDIVEADDKQRFEVFASAYENAGEVIREWKKKRKDLGDKLAVMVGEHQGVKTPDGKVTFKTQERAEHVVKASTTRVLRVSENKEGK